MKSLLISFLLVGCSPKYKKDECFMDKNDGGYFKVLEVHRNSYISQAFGKYKRKDLPYIPKIVPIDQELRSVDCFEGEFETLYMRQLYKLKKKHEDKK